MTIMPRIRRHRSARRTAASRIRRLALPSALAVMAAGLALSPATPASAASVMTVAVTTNPQPVASNQAMAYTITAANTGGADASALTMTDTVTNLAPSSAQTAPFFTSSIGGPGACSYDTTTKAVT